ncbi:amino acid ABC transporter substrate-binding protein [Alteromonadaceae bacterium M269]|nr:amino acid ABC transporter substrate-binding protein [Alteromonadaceae bacterium M269]
MNISRLVFILLLSTLILACSPGPSEEDNKTASTTPVEQAQEAAPDNTPECTFVLGFDSWEPYQYADVGGHIAGLDIELVTAITDKMNCTIDYRRGTWVSLLNELRQGTVDMLLGASKTADREQFALFSDAYRMEEISLYIRKDDESFPDRKSVSDFVENGSKIGITEDYYYGPEVSMLLDGSVTSKFFSSGIMGELNIARLLDHDIDGFLEDSFVGASLIRRKALSDYIVPHGITIQTGDAYVMFSKISVSEEQLTEFNRYLAEIKASDVYDNIVKKYSH